VLMFQTEFAMRLVARPGDSTYSRLSANTQLLARVSHLLKVGRNNFRPPPKVDSSVVRIEPRNPVPDVNFREWDGLLRLCFGCVGACMPVCGVCLCAAARGGATSPLTHACCHVTRSRKNKTLGGIFRQKATLALLEGNYRTWKALQLGTERAGGGGAGGSGDGDAAMGDAEAADDSAEAFKARVVGVLERNGLDQQRSGKMSQDDFLRLLALFNAAGVHFV
jgi:18S rRNA (adenine1779-N6/adenine1780-N6)-dimethyltransferase